MEHEKELKPLSPELLQVRFGSKDNNVPWREGRRERGKRTNKQTNNGKKVREKTRQEGWNEGRNV